MKKLLLILLFLPMIGFGQIQRFEFSKQRSFFPNQYIVMEIDDLSVEDGYNRTLEWIGMISPINFDKSRTFLTPNINKPAFYSSTNTISINNKIQNIYIKMEGIIGDSLKCYYNPTYPVTGYTDVRYYIEFAFKKNKVKFDIIKTEFFIPKNNLLAPYAQYGWANLTLNYSNMYKRNGKIHKGKLEDTQRMIKYFNDLALSLYEYLKDPIQVNEINDDW